MAKIDKNFWYPIVMGIFLSILGIISNNTDNWGKMAPWIVIAVVGAFAVWFMMRLFEWCVNVVNERREKRIAREIEIKQNLETMIREVFNAEIAVRDAEIATLKDNVTALVKSIEMFEKIDNKRKNDIDDLQKQSKAHRDGILEINPSCLYMDVGHFIE